MATSPPNISASALIRRRPVRREAAHPGRRSDGRRAAGGLGRNRNAAWSTRSATSRIFSEDRAGIQRAAGVARPEVHQPGGRHRHPSSRRFVRHRPESHPGFGRDEARPHPSLPAAVAKAEGLENVGSSIWSFVIPRIGNGALDETFLISLFYFSRGQKKAGRQDDSRAGARPLRQPQHGDPFHQAPRKAGGRPLPKSLPEQEAHPAARSGLSTRLPAQAICRPAKPSPLTSRWCWRRWASGKPTSFFSKA